jgi:hypothetical protein
VATRVKRCVLVIGCSRISHRQRSVDAISDLLSGS